MRFRACGCVVSYRFESGLRDLEIGIGTEVGFSNRRDVEISPFSFVKRLDEIAPPSAGPNHVRFRIQKAQKVGCDSEISLAFRPAVVSAQDARIEIGGGGADPGERKLWTRCAAAITTV